MSNELCYLSAIESTSMFRQKKLSPVELMTAVIAQSERVEPAINAFSHTFFDSALEQARSAEARYHKGAARGALDGLPVGIKVNCLQILKQ